MFPILWEILTSSQKLSDRNVLWRDLKSSQSSKANIILATSETTRGVWEKKNGIPSVWLLLPTQECGWTSSFSLRSYQRWESLLTPRCGGWKTEPLFSGGGTNPADPSPASTTRQLPRLSYTSTTSVPTSTRPFLVRCDNLCSTNDVRLYICQTVSRC